MAVILIMFGLFSSGFFILLALAYGDGNLAIAGTVCFLLVGFGALVEAVDRLADSFRKSPKKTNNPKSSRETKEALPVE